LIKEVVLFYVIIGQNTAFQKINNSD